MTHLETLIPDHLPHHEVDDNVFYPAPMWEVEVAAGVAATTIPWDEQTGDWLDENGKTRTFELVDHRSRQRLRAEKRTRLCWRAALSSGRLTVCSKKKNSDGNHGKPFSN